MDTDLQLLARYARTREAEAFKQLVHRHAGMVFAAARRITADHHDAEDVAQACFLELSRHASSIHGSVAGWLHTLATTRAANSNRAAARRNLRERSAARPEAITEIPWDEIAPLVDAALTQLPEELRLAVVLYYLENRGQVEIAAELGIHNSTVSRRIEAGVAALREKLQAAGVMTPSAALPALLAQHAITAAPKTLVTALGKLAVSGLVPSAMGGATSVSGSGGDAGAASGASSAAAKGVVLVVVKVLTGIVLTAAVTTAGIALLPARLPALPASIGVAATTLAPAMDAELTKAVTRLKAEIGHGIGDGVGVLSETILAGEEKDLDSPNPKPPVPHSLALYAQQGRSQLYMYYIIVKQVEPSKAFGRILLDKLPRGWPTPDLDEVLRLADSIQTPALFISDGRSAGYMWDSPEHGRLIRRLRSYLIKKREPSFHWDAFSCRGMFWPNPGELSNAAGNLHIFDHEVSRRIELLRRPDQPAWVGIHLINSFIEPIHGKISPEFIKTYWLDPARNDVPVAEEFEIYNQDGQEEASSTTQFFSYAQSREGRWYPSHWRITTRNENNLNAVGKAPAPDASLDYQLSFDQNRSLDARWFDRTSAHFAPMDLGPAENPPAKSIAATTVIAATAATHAVAVATTAAARSVWWWWPWAVAMSVFAAAGTLLIRQRLHPPAAAPLRGFQGPRRQ